MRSRRVFVLVLAILVISTAWLAMPAVPAQAAEPDPPPPEEGGFLKQVFEIVFPFHVMEAALREVVWNTLKDNVAAVQTFFEDTVTPLGMRNPDVKDEGYMRDAWETMIKIGVALSPAVLAIMAATASQESLLGTGPGMSDFKRTLWQWVAGVVVAAMSLEILSLCVRVSNAMVDGISQGAWSPSMVSNHLLGKPLNMNWELSGGVTNAILMVLVMFAMGLAGLTTPQA